MITVDLVTAYLLGNWRLLRLLNIRQYERKDEKNVDKRDLRAISLNIYPGVGLSSDDVALLNNVLSISLAELLSNREKPGKMWMIRKVRLRSPIF